MGSSLLQLSSDRTSRLPCASDFEVYSGDETVTIALTVEAEDGMPTVVFVPVQKSCIPNLISSLGDALDREDGPRPR